MKPDKRKTTTDALAIIDELHFTDRPEMQAMAREAETRLRLAQQLHDLREQAGLTQREVAERAGTSRSVIARLEQPGYEKHTLSTLRRVAGAMGFDVRVEFVPARPKTVRRAGSAAPRAKPT